MVWSWLLAEQPVALHPLSHWPQVDKTRRRDCDRRLDTGPNRGRNLIPSEVVDVPRELHQNNKTNDTEGDDPDESINSANPKLGNTHSEPSPKIPIKIALSLGVMSRLNTDRRGKTTMITSVTMLGICSP